MVMAHVIPAGTEPRTAAPTDVGSSVRDPRLDEEPVMGPYDGVARIPYHPFMPPCVMPSMKRRWKTRKMTRIGAIIITAAALVRLQSRLNWVVKFW